MKKHILIILSFSMLLLTLCGCSEKPMKETEQQVTFEQTAEFDPKNPGTYGTSLNSVTKNTEELVCKDGLFCWEAELTNEFDKSEYGFMLFVNGVVTPFSTSFNETDTTMHTLSLSTQETKSFTVKVKCEYVPSGTDAFAELVSVLNPGYKLNTTEYLSYLQHHALAGFSFYRLNNNEHGVKCESKVSAESSVIDLPNTLNSVYYSKTFSDKGEEILVNSLDNSNEFLLKSTNDFIKLDSLYTAVRGENLKLKIGCIGKNGKFRLSVYINHEVVPAFDGNMYCDVEVRRDKLTIRNIDLPKEYIESLDEFNHIYIIAVPTQPGLDDGSFDRAIKTASYMLYISDEENVKEINNRYPPIEPPIKYPTAGENTSDPTETETTYPAAPHTTETTAVHTTQTIEQTASQTHTAQKATEPLLSEEKTTVQNTTSSDSGNPAKAPKEISLNAPIYDLWVFEDGSATVQLMDENMSIRTIDTDSGKLGSKSITCGAKIQKLDNMIAVLDYQKPGFTLYDKKLNRISSGKMPFSGDNEFAFAVSYDGKSVVYCINERGRGVVYKDNISMNNRQKILTLSASSKQGAVTWIDEITAVSGNNILFEGSYVEKIDKNSNSILQTCYGSLNTNGNISKQSSSGYNRLCGKGNYLAIADNFSPGGGSPDGKAEYWSAKTGAKSSFTFNSSGESRFVTVSENGKYICGMSVNGESGNSTVKIYDISSGKVLFSNTYPYPPLEFYPIDFCESGNFALLGVGNKIYKISLK